MFWSTETLRCTGGCDISYSIHQSGANVYVYTEGDTDLSQQNREVSEAFLPVLKQRAWCIDCNEPVLAERIPSAREFANAIALLRLPQERRPEVRDDLLDHPIEQVKRLFEHFFRRASPPRCLACETTDIVPFDVRDDGLLVPRLVHEACNSEFKMERTWGSALFMASAFQVRAYSFEGRLVASKSGLE